MHLRLAITLCVVILGCSVTHAASGEEPLDFNRHIRPILSRHCFKCHGMDEKSRKAGLRLDTRDGALAPAKSGERAIVPGKPGASELLRRLHSKDADEVMPPPSTKTQLPPDAAALLERWIGEGAVYAPHWAFTGPRPAPLPEVATPGWVRTPVDRFILARLEKEGLTPASEAPKSVLVRRLYLDLIGLPPSPEEAAAFVNDPAPDAYERLVDHLLSLPQYGERWARRWLDLARYADTNGYEKDRPREIWPYRDWVVRALNADMPFDQFSIRQLAGDLLPNPTPDDFVATGFHRNTMINEEGGIDPLEFRFHAITDRVGTTGTVWLGLTVACAQCHTHKYDPILHTEYYQLMAFLNNAEEPDYAIPSNAVEARRKELLGKISSLEAAMADHFALPHTAPPAEPQAPDSAKQKRRAFVEARFGEWEREESARALRWEVARPVSMASNLALLETQTDGSILASGDVTKSDTYTLRFEHGPKAATALRLEVLPDPSLPAEGPGRTYYEGPKGDFFLSELQIKTPAGPVKVRRATESYAKSGLGGAKVGAQQTLDGNPTTGWSTHGAQGKANAAVYEFEEPTDLSAGLSLTMNFERHYACPLGRFRVSLSSDPKPAEARGHSAEIETILTKAADTRSAGETQLLLQRFLATAPETEAVRKQIDELRNALPREQTTLVLRERPARNPRPTHLHYRGEFTQPREAVAAGVPSFLPPLPEGVKPDRLALARWLFTPEHPLTARVTVNRHWQALFGRGLVRTVEDFGYQGEMPSHPELLDWLALEFRRQGWSVKQLHRLLVTSAVYRQSSAVPAALAARDPQNVLLARAPRFRLESEQIRDAALKASGLLSLKMGGPGVYPSQNPAITSEGTYGKIEWKPSPGAERFRRTLYTFIKRTAPFAMTSTFDGPSGESCVARREVSNSPLQALTVLNDVIFQEAAQALGRVAAAAGGDDASRVTLVFERCLTRGPTTGEIEALLAFLQKQRQRLASGEINAAKLAGLPDSTPDAASHALWTALSRVVLNLDEAITKN
jgi:hypothetical protein